MLRNIYIIWERKLGGVARSLLHSGKASTDKSTRANTVAPSFVINITLSLRMITLSPKESHQEKSDLDDMRR